MNKDGKRLIGYIRVSTPDQSVELQREALLRYGVAANDIHEETASGKSMKRPVLTRLLKVMREGDCLVVWKLDRFGRTVRGVTEAVGLMRERGIDFASVTEQIDTSTPAGNLIFHIMAAVAEMERALISERTKAGMAIRKAAGVKFGPPHAIADNPKRLARYQALYDAGEVEQMTARQIIAEMNAADPKARKITSPQTYYNWRRNGLPGVKLVEIQDAPLTEAGK